MTRRPPFVGRDAEIRVLDEFRGDALAGRPKAVEVVGPPGIGKTTLVRTWLERMALTRRVWIEALPEHSERPWTVVRAAAEALGARNALAAADSGDPVSNPTAPGLELVRDLTGEDVIIVVDDAQWADQASLRALRLFVRSLRDEPVLLVLVHDDPAPARGRDGEQIPDLDPGWHPVFHSERGGRLRLAGLGPVDLIELAQRHGRAGLTPAGAVRLHAHTGGHPLHATLIMEQVELRLINNGRGSLPAPVDEALLTVARFGALSPAAQELVAAGAVLGRRFDFTDAVTVAGLTETPQPGDPRATLGGTPLVPAFTKALAEAVDAGFLETVRGTGGREIQFREPMVRAAIRDELPAHWLRRLHAAAARLGGPGALTHRVLATDPPDEALADALAEAASERLVRNDIGAATALFHDTLRFTPPGPHRTARLLTAVESLLVVGDAVAAERYAAEIAAGGGHPWWDYVAGYQALLNGRIGEARNRLAAAWSRLENPSTGLNNYTPTHAAPSPDQASLSAAAPPDLRARVATQLAVIGIVELDSAAMTRFGGEAIASGSTLPWVRSFAWFARIAGLALAGESRTVAAELSRGPDPTLGGLDTVVAEGLVRLWTDDTAGAEQVLLGALLRARKGEPLRIGQAHGFLAEAEYRLGRLQDAVVDAESAAVQAEENGRYWDLPLLHGIACYPLAARAEWEAAEAHALQANTWAELVTTASARFAAVTARYIIAHARDNVPAMLRGAEVMEPMIAGLEPGILLFGPVRADALSRLGRAAEARAALEPYIALAATTGRRSAAMHAARVRGQIAAAEERYEDAAVDLRSSADLARELGLPLHYGLAELRLAQVLDAARLTKAAAAALAAAIREFTAIDATAYVHQARDFGEQAHLSVAGPDDPFAVLTPRQRPVAELAAATSRPNSWIAQELHLSLKTVEAHLTHVYDTLGVRNRAELRDLYRARGGTMKED